MATTTADMVRDLLNQADAEVNVAAGKGSDATVIAGFKKISEIAVQLAKQLGDLRFELLKEKAVVGVAAATAGGEKTQGKCLPLLSTAFRLTRTWKPKYMRLSLQSLSDLCVKQLEPNWNNPFS